MATKKSQKRRILEMLILHWPSGVSNMALNRIGFRFGGRICELRKQGIDIETGKTTRFGTCLYRLLTPPDTIDLEHLRVKA